MIVNEQKKIEFINDCKAIVNYEELEKAIIWYQDRPTSRVKHIYLQGRYPTVTIFNKKIQIHRLLMMYWIKDKNIKSDLYVHHIDYNKLNATKNNLILINVKQHQSIHNKGKTISEEQKEKIRLFNYSRKGLKCKKQYIIDIRDLIDIKNKKVSINKIAKKYGCEWSVVKSRLYENKELLGDE